ncbi:MAG: polyhydroxyalkanoate depolymerase [Robiginitomaculum sp.]|nr:polyhydroxyalkanoate depolymerase [Robiginitomaculum sp.]MDQ7076296.1 polyhydroxyalkanoate depolymerase [Robiginitomaculum sp.]
MLYSAYEFTHAALKPWRQVARGTQALYTSPLNPWSGTLAGRSLAASADLFERLTRRYGKPAWDIESTSIDGRDMAVTPMPVLRKPWLTLTHFGRDIDPDHEDPKLLIVAPLSGHYATLLRGTVEAFLPAHEVFITEWSDARTVPVIAGRFDLHDYVDHIREVLRFLGPNTHVLAVCQPGPLVLAAAALMAEDDEVSRPASLTLMGSPIDTRCSPTLPNELAKSKSLDWFARNVISTVPMPNAGAMRRVYPGFVQLASFIQMNKDTHVDAHRQFFDHLVAGDGDSTRRHRAFYDEYLSVMDLTEEFYLQTIREVFQEHRLARGLMRHGGRAVDPGALTDMALMTIEGELDDISGIGQTQAAHDLCSNIPATMRKDYVQEGVGHYGVFSGRRFRENIAPRIADFIREHDAP